MELRGSSFPIVEGWLLLGVNAYPWGWSEIDRILGCWYVLVVGMNVLVAAGDVLVVVAWFVGVHAKLVF